MSFYVENAVPTTKFNLLQYRWYRDWYRTTAFSVDPYEIFDSFDLDNFLNELKEPTTTTTILSLVVL